MISHSEKIKSLTNSFNALNKVYVSLDKSLAEKVTEDAEILTSQKLEAIQSEMSKISTEIERLENL